MSLENIVLFLDRVKPELSREVLETFGKHSQTFEQFDEVSKLFFKIKDYDKSIEFGEKAYAIASTPQQMYIIRHNLINVYNHNNYPEKALRYIRANEAVLKDDNDRDFEKAFSLFLLNRKSEAAELLRSKLSDTSLNEEQRIKLEFNLGTYDLIDGNLQQGLKRFLLSGEQMGIWDNTKTFITQPLETYGLQKWNHSIKPNMNLLIIAEAGIGDEIINVRFVKRLESFGINVYWLVASNRKDLSEIYKLNGINSVTSITDIPSEFLQSAVYIPSMQLPIALNCSYNDLWNGPYLDKISDEYNSKWVKYFDNFEGKKIGIRWQGNPSYDQDLHRSIPLKEIISVIPHSNNLFSIQRDTGLEELQPFSNPKTLPYVEDLSKKLVSLHDLFACINNLDLVITSCTSVAHIAASMGKQVCIIVPISCYYVWCNPNSKTPWYGDNVRVFYQQKPRVWDEPLLQLFQYLTK